MSTLVTGATGFLGKYLVEALLARGERVRVLVRPDGGPREMANLPVEITWGDLLTRHTLDEAMDGVERVYHAAAKVHIDASSDLGMARLNSEGTRNLLESAWRAGVERVVYTSSVAVIGGTRDGRLLSERDAYAGCGTQLPYAQSKVLADRIVMQFVARGLPVVPVYPTLFFGPGDRNLNTSRTVLMYLEGRAPAYIAGGFGCADVRDVARGHVSAMARGQVGRRYILGGANVTLLQFYKLLEQITHIRAPSLRIPPALAHVAAAVAKWIEPYRGKPPAITRGDVENGRLFWFYDYSRARDELDYTSRPLADTLRDTVAWLTSEVLGGKSRIKTDRGEPTPKFSPHFSTVTASADAASHR